MGFNPSQLGRRAAPGRATWLKFRETDQTVSIFMNVETLPKWCLFFAGYSHVLLMDLEDTEVGETRYDIFSSDHWDNRDPFLRLSMVMNSTNITKCKPSACCN